MSLIFSTYEEIQGHFFELFMNGGGGKNFNHNIQQRLRRQILIISYNEDISNLLKEMSKFKLFICNRFHSILLSIILAISFIAVNPHPKVKNFLRDIRLEDYEIDVERILDLNFVDDLVDFVLNYNKPMLRLKHLQYLVMKP